MKVSLPKFGSLFGSKKKAKVPENGTDLQNDNKKISDHEETKVDLAKLDRLTSESTSKNDVIPNKKSTEENDLKKMNIDNMMVEFPDDEEEKNSLEDDQDPTDKTDQPDDTDPNPTSQKSTSKSRFGSTYAAKAFSSFGNFISKAGSKGVSGVKNLGSFVMKIGNKTK